MVKLKKQKLVLRNRSWEYVEVDDLYDYRSETPTYGETNHSALRIVVDKSATTKKDLRDTQVHELLHALFPFCEEGYIQERATELTNALCELNLNFKRGWMEHE